MADVLTFNIGNSIVEVPPRMPEAVARFIMENNRLEDSREDMHYITPEKVQQLVRLIFGQQVQQHWSRSGTDPTPYLQAVFRRWGLAYVDYDFNMN